MEFLNLIKNKKNVISNKILYSNYKSFKEIDNNNKNLISFDPLKHILDIKYFGIRMPYIIFLLYTWYSIYYRRIRYNIYISIIIFIMNI